ncbi:MAG TPA: 23S rRNA (pseudouridine(1915)-N(3))-methyltransferase RlmH [Parachlamydiaceae bacterium]|nr:23S rRNA (pseudouridine(1915)-N(3))-methyltransferase RlmH [Parachlamydiaceae bacterium]
MYKLRIFSVGKTKEDWLEQAIAEYIKRLQHTTAIEFVWAKNDEQLIALVEKEEAVVCLDALGQMMDSEKFSSFLVKQLETNGSRLSFVIGGAEGLPASFKKKYPLISFSLMTFTHQIIRLILVEQIYRGIEISKGSRYHK